MHESEAMKFIDPVLEGFFSRNFDCEESENPKKFDVHLKRIKSFINDSDGFWVMEKTLYIINIINQAETEVFTQKYVPSSPEAFIDMLLSKTSERIKGIADHWKTDNGKVNVFVPFPKLPKEK